MPILEQLAPSWEVHAPHRDKGRGACEQPGNPQHSGCGEQQNPQQSCSDEVLGREDHHWHPQLGGSYDGSRTSKDHP